MSDTRGAVETDPSVCYRHPGRQSWVLCQRCGRTVCPECQIQAPVGVHCPECVAETSGAVTWRPNNVAPIKPQRRRRQAQRVRTLLQPAGITWNAPTAMLGTAIALFLIGAFTDLPFRLLAALPSGFGSLLPFPELQLWRYVTAPFVSSAGSIGFGSIIFFALSAVFFWLSAPQLDRMLGTRTFLIVVGVASVVGNAATVISGQPGLGLYTILFGSFGALLVAVWDDRQVRSQILIMIAVNLLLSIVLSGGLSLPGLVGGIVGGAGALYLLRSAPSHWKPRTPALIIGATCAGLILVAALRGGVLG
ncbi:rhomboid family intramembrane serine protease [Amnibacterium endophyticum]|uniref:Rhomboid family intramembrane serine protease n=1 Tax=Amnibacterium endophyticum TaxID=2109337 RepID=A0ABW4LEI1_9MICO